MRVRVCFLAVVMAIGCTAGVGQSNAAANGSRQAPDATKQCGRRGVRTDRSSVIGRDCGTDSCIRSIRFIRRTPREARISGAVVMLVSGR